MLTAIKGFAVNLWAGFRLACFMRANAGAFRSNFGAVALIVLADMVAIALLQALGQDGDMRLHLYGPNAVIAVAAVFAALTAMLRAGAPGFDLTVTCAGLAAAVFWILLAACGLQFGLDHLDDFVKLNPAQEALLERWGDAAVLTISAVWFVLILWRAARIFGAGQRKRLALSLLVASLAALILVPHQPMVYGADTNWDHVNVYQLVKAQVRERAQPRQAERPKPLDVEATYDRQPLLLDRMLGGLAPRQTGRTNLYFLGAALYASQDVFLKEVTTARTIIDQRLGTQGRSALLTNHRDTITTAPLANSINLERALARFSGIMDTQEDILFLFITSHGDAGVLAVDFPRFSMNNITAPRLAQMLNKSGIKNRLIVISACYSGSFIPNLKNENTVIMTAARADRSSFGCSNEREWTYFGDAFFAHAMAQTADPIAAFEIARTLIAQWEREQKLTPSEPQIFVGSAIEAKLAQMKLAQQEQVPEPAAIAPPAAQAVLPN